MRWNSGADTLGPKIVFINARAAHHAEITGTAVPPSPPSRPGPCAPRPSTRPLMHN